MDDSNLMICRTCKTIEWTDDDFLHEYIEEHEAHNFTILTDGTRENMSQFRAWFLAFLGWPEEVKE